MECYLLLKSGLCFLEFAQLLNMNKVVKGIKSVSRAEFQEQNGIEFSEIEGLQLNLPISSLFSESYSVSNYIDQYNISPV